MQAREKNFLITGLPGAGKTTLIMNLLSELKIPADGFITREIRRKGTRVGFMIEDLKGKSELLASTDFPSPFRVGKYRVNLEGFEKIALASLERGLKEARLIVIDEIGKMELFSQSFQEMVLKVMDSPKPALATIIQKPHPFADKIKKRPDVIIYKLSREKFEKIFEELKTRLENLTEKS